MNGPLRTCLLLISLALVPGAASAGSWVFQRSYYSHTPATRVQIGPRSYGGPYYTRAQGEFVRYGVRQIQSGIYIPGSGVDRVWVWETWVQPGSQR